MKRKLYNATLLILSILTLLAAAPQTAGAQPETLRESNSLPATPQEADVPQGSAGFVKIKTYESGTFTDLDSDAWYNRDVVTAYELGLMTGMDKTSFAPDGPVTVAQGIAVAARVYTLYNGGGGVFQQGDPWYRAYVDFAMEKGFVSPAQFDSFDREIKRYEMALLLVNALPAECYPAINEIASIPDVSKAAPYHSALLLLYNAGVLTGNDAYGAFFPNSNIIRSELSAVLCRTVLPESRKRVTLLGVKLDDLYPYYLIDDQNMPDASNYGQYGWDFDNRGGAAGSSAYAINDISATQRVALIRKVTETVDGTLTLESVFSPVSADNGFFICLGGDESAAAFLLITKGGFYHVMENGVLVETGIRAERKQTFLKAIVDLGNKTNQLYLDGKEIGTYGFARDCVKINQLMYASTQKDKVIASVGKTKLYANYAVNEMFISTPPGNFPQDWIFEGENGARAAVAFHNSNQYDENGLTLTLPAKSGARLIKRFEPVSNKVCFEMKFLLRRPADNITFALLGGGEDIFRFAADGTNLCGAGGETLRKFDPTVWQTLRIEANFDTRIASVRVNTREVFKTEITAGFADMIEITANPGGDTELLLDDFFVFSLFDEREDYVPAPIPVETKGYQIGIETCDIWRNGFHYGWDYVSPFEELTPYLGYYDEGATEVADWETKWMVEHGIDFRLVCWYSSTGSSPMKTPRNSFGLNDGFLNSKYSDRMKYAIMWENTSHLPKNQQEFRDYIVPYWVEYYLTDHRYMTIDNKPLITIYRTQTMIEMFGSIAGVKKQTDYLREVCKGLGYDGAVILAISASSDEETLKAISDMGFDGVYAYHWGKDAHDPEMQKRAVTIQDGRGVIDTIPTVAVGFNDVAINGTRSPIISREDYGELLLWVRDEFLAKRADDCWQSKMVLLSNWNEFGEGHFLMPASGTGFGYLDAIRAVFTEDPEHTDILPDSEARRRFCNLFVQHRKRIRRLFWETEAVDPSDLSSALCWDFSNKTDRAQWKTHFSVYDYRESTSSVSGKSASHDFAIIMTGTVSLPLRGVGYARVRMRNTQAEKTASPKAEIFFVTKEDQAYDEKKKVAFNIIPDGEFHDYYVDMSQNKNWAGTLAQLRFDPMTAAGEFEIRQIELLCSDTGARVIVNGREQSFDFSPVEDNGLMVSINPHFGIFADMGIFHTWDHAPGTLTMLGESHSVVMTMGARNALVDGRETPMPAIPYLRDGLPVIPLDFLARSMGYEWVADRQNYYIGTLSAEYAALIADRRELEWEFDVPGDLEGWTIASARLDRYEDGAVHFVSVSNGKRHDPAFISPEIQIQACDFGGILVRMRHCLTDEARSTASVFFRKIDSSFDEQKSVKAPIERQSSDAEYWEYLFDMSSNPFWQGTVTGIRFDPFEAEGIFAIDSIRIIKNQ